MDEHKRTLKPNPLSEANYLSQLFFWWLNPLFRLGYKQNLGVEDMYEVENKDSSQYLCSKLEREWEKEKRKYKEGGKPRLLFAFIRAFGKPYALIGIFVFMEEVVKVVQPMLLGGLIRYFDPRSKVTAQEAYLYAMGVSVCALLLAIFHHPYFYYVMKVGMWLRISACSLLYKKALKLSNHAMNKITTGHIVNLMSNDVNRFDQATLFLHFLWVGPIQACVVLAILWQIIGPASLAGFMVLILLIPVQGNMGRLFSKLRRKTAVLTDERVKVMNEILTGMRVIKMYCWEKMFHGFINKIRRKEIQRIRMGSYARALILAPFFISGKLIVYLTFLTFTLMGHKMASDLAFVAIALYNPVRLNMTLFLPFSVTLGSEALVTIKRLQDFLLLEELEDTITPAKSPAQSPVDPTAKSPAQSPADATAKSPATSSECKITALQVTGSWDKAQGNTLTNVSVEVRPGELVAVIGPVGSGKSSLLMALLGELPLTSGSVKVTGKIGYAAQQPWVFSASVRQNIIFGLPFDPKKYQRVIKAAALTKDLEIMPSGDQTLVGERGVSLSGGQKARVSLARALYYEADVYLLDDPLSAVDTSVGRHIFDKCICGVLRDKPVILVTHQLQYLQAADRILIMKEGEIHGSGTYKELSEGGVDFAALLQRDEDEDEDDAILSTEMSADKPADQLPEREAISQSLDCKHLASYMSQLSEQHQPLLSKSVIAENRYLQQSLPDLDKTVTVKQRSNNGTIPHANHLTNGPSSISTSQQMNHLQEVTQSMLSLTSLSKDIKPEFVAAVQEEETRVEGTVSVSLYGKYFRAGAGYFKIFVFIFLNVVCQVTYVMADWWLSYWASQEEERQEIINNHQNVTNTTIPQIDRTFNLLIYSGITASLFLFGILRAVITCSILVCAAKALHNKMFASIIRAPILFFDTNPVGRILNRFSKDTGQIDEILPLTVYDFIQCALVILSIIIVTGVVNPWVFIPVIPLAIVFYILRRYYLQTSRDIKRLEGTTRSPVFSHLSASLQGLWTIRAFGVQNKFIEEFDVHQNIHTSAWFLFLATTRWFAVRLDLLCAAFVTAVSFCSVLASNSQSAGLVGLSVMYALSLMGLFQWGVRQSAEVENQMTSVERVWEYSKIPPEAALDSTSENKPPPAWPEEGVILTQDASYSYTEDGKKVLRGLSFCIQTKEKVGLVGRTGAGKSSLISMLFRLAEPTGTIKIDGLNILDLGLHDLRKKISIIPQDPVLFTGSVRRNLDPFEQHSDTDVWQALEEVQMKPAIQDLEAGLEHEISEGGANFSVGQRQLFCLGRAILRRNNILVIDEATANVDPRTDALIQQTIREKFRQCTVLTIAHRLHTVMDSDRVMVLDEGHIVEFDKPYTLLQDDKSHLYRMVENTGSSEMEKLVELARQSFILQTDHDEVS